MLLRSAGPASFFCVLALLLGGALGGAPVAAQTPPFTEIHTIAAATTGVPQEYSFDVSTAGTYTVTLTDLGATLTPSAPLASVGLGVTGGSGLIGTPLSAAGTLTLSALAPGTYTVHVVGTPGNVPGSGGFGVQVDDSSMTQVAAFQGTLALPSQALPNGEAVLNDTFMVNTAGLNNGAQCAAAPGQACFTVTLTDLTLPQSLSAVTLALIAQGAGPPPLLTLSNSGALSGTLALSPGVTYRIFAVAAAGAPANAGLFSAVVAPTGGGAIAYGRAVPVGSTQLVGSPALKAGNGALTLTDLGYPTALSQVAAALTLNGQAVGQLSSSGSQAFVATAGTYEAFVAATPAASPGTGSYALQVAAGGATALSVGRGVTAAGGAQTAYSFDTTLATGGAYSVSLADFQFPASLTTVSLGAVQSGALLGTPINSATSLNITAATGPLSLVVFAQPSAPAGGLFGIDVTPGGGANAAYEVTQAVGAIFNAQRFTIVSAGNYSVTAKDLGWPANFSDYDTIVTQGTKSVGSIFGGGTFNFNATPGDYFINFIAQPSGAAQAGTYSLSVATAPPAPVVTLSADHSQVSSGSTVNLIWSSQNATSCTASNGWTGTKPLSGTATTAALTSNTTFTLGCTGAGGTTSKSVSVTVTTSSGSGGGAMDLALLLSLATLLALRSRVMQTYDTSSYERG